MRRARWLSVLVGAGLLGSCGDGLEPPTTGSIALIINVDQLQQVAAPVLARAAADSAAAGDSGTAVAVTFDAMSYTSARARAVGPSTRTVDLQLVDNFWEGSIDNLAPGTYTVTVEGLQDGEISALGTTSGVDVVAGQEATASVSLTSFLPTVTVGITSPTTALEIPVSISAITTADGYRVEWAANPEFTSASSRNLTETSTTLSLSSLGTFYVRARALSGTTPGAPGAAKSFETIGDVPGTGETAGAALSLGFGTAANQRLTQLNIVPTTDVDWFSLEGCMGDNVTIETFAARLTPASKLNTQLRLFGPDGTTQIAQNDDLDGTTTDSRIQVMLLGDDTYTLQVSSVAPGSIGRYEIEFTVTAGAKNKGTYCQIVKRVDVSPATATIAAGATQQLTAAGFDEADQPVPGVKYLWVSSNTNVAVVDTTGLVTGVGGGEATISALGQGEPGNAVITVTGAPLGAPTQLAFSVQPSTTTAGAAFSPAIDVEIRDANGNLVTGARNAVTLALADNPGGATVFGTTTVSANGGIARFTGLSMDRAAAGYTFSATSAGLTNATSDPFTVSPGAPRKLTFGTQPANIEGNTVFAAPVTVTISDAFGNVVPTATNAITLLFQGNPWRSVFGAGGTLAGTTTRNAVNGVATFNDLRVDKPGPAYSLLGRATGLDSAVSTPFDVNLTVSTVAVSGYSGYHTCATGAAGTYCWGLNNQRQLGTTTGSTSTDSVAALVEGGPFVQVSAGASHSCGLTSGGAAFCWGDNSQGQLGNGNAPNDSPVPVAVSGGLTFATISAGERHTCAVTGAGAAYCWGSNSNGQLGLPPLPGVAETETNNTAGTADAVSIGNAGTGEVNPAGDADYWVFAATAGTVLNLSVDARKIGSPLDPTLTLYASDGTTQLAYNDDFDGLDSRIGYTVPSSGNYYVAVRAYAGGGGPGQTYRVNIATAATAPTTPQPVSGGLVFANISAGYRHTCGVTTGGDGYCWGWDGIGMLGDDAGFVDKSVPTVVNGGMTWTAISAGAGHTCGRTTAGAGYCWGYNVYGQLGNNSTTDIGTPVAVNGGLTFSSVSAGGFQSCGVAGGDVYCWGLNDQGQLGNNQQGTNSSVPVAVSGGLTFNTVFAGAYHTCGRSGTAVYCWGNNNYGQLGNGESSTTRAVPVQIVQ